MLATVAVVLSLVPGQSSDRMPQAPWVTVQAWTFNRTNAVEAIGRVAACGAKYIELYPGQRVAPEWAVGVGPDMPAEAEKRLVDALVQAGVRPVAFGVTGIPNDEARARNLFEWAKRLGIRVINTESTDSIDVAERLAKELDISVGYHNHPKSSDPNYKVWNPQYIYDLVKQRDRRLGACADTGHWVRSGIKPVDALKTLRGRVVSSHLKDLHEFSAKGYDVPYGFGVSDVNGILAAFSRGKWAGPISVEYERFENERIIDVAQCVGYLRGKGL
ncbi:MAG: sugar phosphate isomerase/epimerase [Fimbriimonadaceae bacterium]|nr:sugar phosphate isomerase/epimerase [Fimbriimonadaceae bacterium]